MRNSVSVRVWPTNRVTLARDRSRKMRQRHKREDYDFRQLKDATTAPPVKRARGGRTGDPAARQEAGNHERHASKDPLTAHTKSRPRTVRRKKLLRCQDSRPGTAVIDQVAKVVPPVAERRGRC